MKLSLVIPFIDQPEITKRCIEVAVDNAGADFELVLIDNGSDLNNGIDVKDFAISKITDSADNIACSVVANETNIGVLPTFKMGFEATDSDVICFIHNDVLLQELGWVNKVLDAFKSVDKLGLAGIFGAVGVGDNGGRIRSQSKMLGVEWGKCDCHDVAWKHHSEYLDGLAPATILDGVGMFFSRAAANALLETDIFDDWRAPHHHYDRIIPLKLIDRGFKIATIGIGFDHWSGATANSSKKYEASGKNWLIKHNQYQADKPIDQQIYNIAEQQFFEEFRHRIPCTVDSEWQYHWQGIA